MSKFNRDVLKKDNILEETTDISIKKKNELTVQEAFLSIEGSEKRDYIDMELLKPNLENHYSVEDVEDLANMIKMADGILQDIIVKPKDEQGFFTITTGERRWRAAKLLKERGEYPRSDGKVPCQIKNPDDLRLPLDTKSKEQFMILVTNKYRDKTDSDRMMEMREWKKIFTELRKKGVEYIAIDPTDSEESRIPIKGRRTRELVADQLGISTGQVARMENVEKKSSDVVLKKLLNSEMSFSEAEEATSFSKKEQEDIVKESDDTGEAIKKIISKRKEKKVYTINKKEIEKDLRSINSGILDDNFQLSESQYNRYKTCIMQLKKMLGVRDK